MPPINDDDDIPQAAAAHAIKCACGCGIVSVKLFGYDDEPLAEIVFQPLEWLDFVGRLKVVHLHS
jgi:hypothetical protein